MEKCGRKLFEIVSPTDDFETIINEDYPSCQIVTVISLSKLFHLILSGKFAISSKIQGGQ